MLAGQENTIERALGRLEGQLDGVVATLERVDKRSAARDEKMHELVTRVTKVEEHAEKMTEVAGHVTGLQQLVRDGKMQGKGILLGFGLATGAVGATVATFIKHLLGASAGN